MMEFVTNTPIEFGMDYQGRATMKITLPPGTLPDVQELVGKPTSVSVEALSKKRSKSQNAYLWSLLSQMASKLGTTKEEVYRQFVRDYGVSDFITISPAAAPTFRSMWAKKGLGWESEVVAENGKMVDLAVYYGSSAYDSKEMSRLLGAVIDECNALGIATCTLEEAMKLEGN